MRDILCQLPTIDKGTLIENICELMCEKSFLSSSKTAGVSTGDSVVVYTNLDALARGRVATARSEAWVGIHVGEIPTSFLGFPARQNSRFKAKLIDLVANRL